MLAAPWPAGSGKSGKAPAGGCPDPIVQIGSGQKICADHLQTVTARFVGSEHQGCRLNCLLDNRNLAFIKLEINNFPRLGLLSGQFPFERLNLRISRALCNQVHNQVLTIPSARELWPTPDPWLYQRPREASFNFYPCLPVLYCLPIWREWRLANINTSTRQVNGVTIVGLSGRITLGEASVVVRDLINDLMGNGHQKIVLNLAEVNYVDSSGIGVLVGSLSSVRKQGGELKLVNVTKRIRDLLQITKLYSLFDIKDDEATAVASFR
jgi:anti-sigma B factor antagonist